MLKLQEIYKICEGLEYFDRKTSIRKLISKGCSEKNAVNYYNIWRRHYLETMKKDIELSGIHIKKGNDSKLIEECSYKERESFLQALSKEQLIKITQAVLK